MKILVVDDDPVILDAITVGIELQWPEATVIPARDGEQGLRAFDDHEPDVVVLDVAMPARNGFEVLREIRRVSDVPVIMLTARAEEHDQVKGLELGADDYVTKPFGHLALLARIKAVLRRVERTPLQQPLPDMTVGDLTINFREHQVLRGGEPVALTPVEFKLLYHLVRNSGRLMAHEVLLERIWGSDHTATTDNLKVMVSRLRAKLEGPAGPHYIETERGVGYRFVRPRPGP